MKSYIHWGIPTLVLIALCIAVSFSSCGKMALNSNEDKVSEAWIARYDGKTADDDGGEALAIDGMGNIYVTGYSWGSDSSSDYATIKYDAAGNQLWIERYNGPANKEDWALDLAVDSTGNAYVTGWSQGNDTEADCATIKYDGEGNQLWVARYNSRANGYDMAYAIALDYADNVYITGWSQGFTTQEDFITIKYDNNGNIVWAARYDGPVSGEDRGYDIAVDTWANVYVTGWSQGNGTKLDYSTVKYDTDGNQLWVARYDGPNNGDDQSQSIAVDHWGNIYVTGWSEGVNTETDFTTIKYNSFGDQIWVARYDGPARGEDKATDMIVDMDGSIYVTGWSKDYRTDIDYTTIKYDGSGNQIWVVRYNGPADSDDVAKTLDIDAFGNVYVSGWSRGIGARYDYATIKYGPDGSQIWAVRYNGPASGHDKIYAMAVDSTGNVYVTGRSSGETTYYDFTTIKYSQR